MALQPGQVLKRVYPCKRCSVNIRIAPENIDASGKVTKWTQYNDDDTLTKHVCKNGNGGSATKKDGEEQPQQPSSIYEKLEKIEGKIDLLQKTLELLVVRKEQK